MSWKVDCKNGPILIAIISNQNPYLIKIGKVRTHFKADDGYHYIEDYAHLFSDIHPLVVSNDLEIEHLEEPSWNMSYPDLGDIRPIPAALVMKVKKQVVKPLGGVYLAHEGVHLRTAVSKYGEVFETGTVPRSLMEKAVSVEVVALGEVHYKQEHQDFLVELARRLYPHGLRLIVGELMHAYSWIVDDYVTGAIDSVPDEILFFDQTTLAGLRALNQHLPARDMVHYGYIDLNHWNTSFLVSVKCMEQLRGPMGIFKAILALDPLSEAYVKELDNIKSLLSKGETRYRAELGERWYDRIVEMVDVEICSTALRKVEYDSSKREPIMTQLISRRFKENPGLKIVNCGWNHIQKKHFNGPGGAYELVGEYLASHHKSFHIGFAAVRGERRNGFRDSTEHFNILDFASQEDLLRIVSERQGNHNLYLQLDDMVFDEVLPVADGNKNGRMKPKQQFDAMIVYPEVHILESMERYDQCTAIMSQRQYAAARALSGS